MKALAQALGETAGNLLRAVFAGVPWCESIESDGTLRLPAPAGGALHISNAHGRTRVVGEARADIQVEIRKTARAESQKQAFAMADAIGVKHRLGADGALELAVQIPRRRHDSCRCDLQIRAPRGTAVRARAANGRVCLEGLRAAVQLQSSNGPVQVNDVVGDVEIQTSNAKVHTRCTCGRMRARSSNGKIELAGHKGAVDAATSNGTIRCRLEGLAAEGCRLLTSNGRIALELPPDTDADVDLRVENGAIRCSREVVCGRAARERSGRLRGVLGLGGAPIWLRASNGGIYLR